MVDDTFLIQEKYVDTKYGKCKMVTISEYKEFCRYASLLVLQKFQVLKQLKVYLDGLENPKKIEAKEYYREIKQLTYIQIINSNIMGLKDMYNKLFSFCFECNVLSYIKNDKELIELLDLIIHINGLSLGRENPNPMIEKFNILNRLKTKNNKPITYKKMYTSIWSFTGNEPKPSMTLYAFFALFEQIAQLKSYDTSVLFKTVSKDIQIPTWYEDISKKDVITQEEFEQSSQELFNNKK